MKKLYSLAAAATMVLAGTTAYAADLKTSAFPPTRPVQETQQTANGPKRAPLNQERAKGLKVFGATQQDYNLVRHFVNYYEKVPMLENLTWISKEDENGISQIRNLHMINAGAYNPDDGYYYAYKVEYYTIGITYALQWLRVDPATGEWSIVANLDNHMHDTTYLYDMAYSTYDSEMYGLVQNSDGQIKSRIGVVDMTDSSLSNLVQLDDYYFGITFDLDGKLYGIRWDYDSDGDVTGTRLDEFDSDFKVTKSTEILVDGAPFKSYFQHGLDYDPTTGLLVWGATDGETGNQKMVTIDPKTYQTRNLGGVGFNELMIGLHVPYEKADDLLAPARVNSLGSSLNNDGAEKVTLNWANPSLTWNRQPLTDLSKVYIYRDNLDSTPVAELDATGMEGSRMNWTDENAPKGVRTYYVMAANAKGKGVMSKVEAYSGHDTPGSVLNLAVASIDKGTGVKVTWDKPLHGDSEGWFDSQSVTYSIVRNPGNTTLATGLTATEYEDKDIPEAQFYTYTVTPSNADGTGTPAETDGILAGKALKVPFSTDFESANEANRFQSLDNFGINNQIMYDFNPLNPGEKAMVYSYMEQNNIILVSPTLNLEKGKKYRVIWNFSLNRAGKEFDDYYNHFQLIGGAERTYESMTANVFADYNNLLTEQRREKESLDGYFECPVDGDYNVGFRILTGSKNNDARIYITGFSIYESPEKDLEVEDITVPLMVSSEMGNYFDVDLYNNGNTDASGYKVEVGVSTLNGSFLPIATASEDVPTIKVHEKATIRLEGHGNFSGAQDLQARVIYDGDGYAANNVSELKEVNFYTGVPFNFHATDKKSKWTSTEYPFYLYNTYSATQSIYPASHLNFDKEENEIGGLAWEYSLNSDAMLTSINDLHLKIYLGQTDKTYYDESNPNVLDGQTLVYDGTTSLNEGGGWLTVTLDKPFKADNKKNLVVTLLCEESQANGGWPFIFNIYNSPNSGPDYSDGVRHSIRYKGETEFSFTSSTVYSDEVLPVLHVGVKGASGIEGVADDSTSLRALLLGRTLHLFGGAKALNVYDLSGRLLMSAGTEGLDTVELPLPAGVYAVRVSDAAGNVKVTKIILK